MRVISGIARGTKLDSRESNSTRPTLDRIKENMFNLIQNNIQQDSIVLDLFAGSGQLGIEALSRGATKCYFCDIDKEDITFIKKNIAKTHLEEKSEIIHDDFRNALNILKDKFDLIFIDPPYKSEFVEQSLEILYKKALLNNDGIIIVETDETPKIQELLDSKAYINILKTKNYGRVTIFIISFQN